MTTQYDLTGTDPDYLVTDQRYVVYKETQVIPLPGPAYPDTISVSQVNGSVVVPLTKGVDWSIRDSDYSSVATSKAKLTDPTFDTELVTSVTMNKLPSPQYTISIEYQQLEVNRIVANLNSETDLSFTPDLLMDILQNISYLRNIYSPTADTSSDSFSSVSLLPEDITGALTSNLITDELHTVDVPNNKQIIRPVQGSFFKDSVVVTVVSSGVDLIEGTDYTVGGMDISRTKSSTSSSGVYRHIYLLASVVGDVKITYQAYGGETTIEDFEQLQENLEYIYTYLNSAQFVTTETLGQADIIDTLIRRITQVEERMRILTTTGSPSYGDKTNGIARLYKFTVGDTNKHWFNLSSLYTVAGSSDIITQDRVHYRIRTVESKMMFDVYISANLYDPVNPFSIDVSSDLSYTGYSPFMKYDDLDNRVYPEFRVIWTDDADVRSGAYLQIGLALKNVVTETVVVEDLSGNECCWILEPLSEISLENKDDMVLMPDGISVWSKLTSISKKVSAIAPLDKGYLGWAGSMTTADLEETTTLNHIFDSRDIDIEQIKVLKCEFFDRYKDTVVSAACNINKTIEDPIWVGGTVPDAVDLSGEEFFHLDDFCKIKLDITQAISGNITLSAKVSVGEQSYVNSRFELRQIIALF